jgi:hypothetical protein
VIIAIDLTGEHAAVELAEPEDCKRFHVAVRGGDPRGLHQPPQRDVAALGAALSAGDVGRLLPSGEAMIDTAAVLRMADGRVPEGWEDEFAAMLKYAESKGWLDETGGSIQAHVEWAT